MAEDKVEGEVRKASSGSSVEEGHFGGCLDGQISTIEEQLQRAQATLFELQSIKGKLEAEKQDNLLRAQREQEYEEALSIKKENERLRHELHGYHDEIGSLKEIISTLKEDLVHTAEKLEKKVSHTLESLDENDQSHHARHATSHTEEKQQHRQIHHQHAHKTRELGNFFSDHLELQRVDAAKEEAFQVPKMEVVEVKDQSGADQAATGGDEPAAGVVEAKESQTQTNVESRAEVAEPNVQEVAAPAAPIAAASPSPQAEVEAKPVETQPVVQEAAPEVKAETAAPASEGESIADKMLQQDASTNQVEPVAITQININDSATAEDLIDSDFDEYEDIKKELEALEKESIFKAVAQPDPIPEEEPEKPKAKFALFSKKKSGEEQDALAPQQKLETAEQYKKHFWGRKEQAKPTDSEAAVAQAPAEGTAPVATQPIVETKPAESAVPATATVEATVASPSVQEAPATTTQDETPVAMPTEQVVASSTAEAAKSEEASPLPKLSQVFKKRKKKIHEEVGEEHREKHGGAIGKLVVRAAIFILVITGAGLAYRVSNANKLREMYTSKAKESVEQTKTQQAPDGFSDQSPEEKYKEAYVDAPFADTIWSSYKDPDLGIVLDYPQNTSYRLKPIGSSNLWFLRKNGYLLKIEKIETDQTIDQYMQGITNGVKYKTESANVRNHNTLHLVLEDNLPVRGNIYLVQMDDGVIYKIWYKTFTENEDPDDQQRVKRMLDTLDFIS